MYKLYRYSVYYRARRGESVINGSEFPIHSMYFLDYSDCHSECIQIMRAPVPSFIKDRLSKKYKGSDSFASCYQITSIMVDDNTYNELLSNHALKGVVF